MSTAAAPVTAVSSSVVMATAPGNPLRADASGQAADDLQSRRVDVVEHQFTQPQHGCAAVNPSNSSGVQVLPAPMTAIFTVLLFPAAPAAWRSR